MGHRDMWKMIHLIYLYGKPGLTDEGLFNAGVDCHLDTIQPLIDGNVIERDNRNSYNLSRTTRELLRTCVLANSRFQNVDTRVDCPEAFVIMPFSEVWSQTTYEKLIRPAIEAAGLTCTRGDTLVRVGDLTTNIWQSILRAGVVIAEVSVPNVNVFYELGLVHALGKDTILLKRADSTLPADFGGAHYHEYDPIQLELGKKSLQRELDKWAEERHVKGVKALAEPSR